MLSPGSFYETERNKQTLNGHYVQKLGFWITPAHYKNRIESSNRLNVYQIVKEFDKYRYRLVYF